MGRRELCELVLGDGGVGGFLEFCEDGQPLGEHVDFHQQRPAVERDHGAEEGGGECVGHFAAVVELSQDEFGVGVVMLGLVVPEMRGIFQFL